MAAKGISRREFLKAGAVLGGSLAAGALVPQTAFAEGSISGGQSSASAASVDDTYVTGTGPTGDQTTLYAACALSSWGFVDAKGKWAIDPQFSYSEETCNISPYDNLYYSNLLSKVPGVFDSDLLPVNGFTHGDMGSKYYINKRGEVVIGKLADAYELNEDLAPCRFASGDDYVWRFVNGQGDTVIDDLKVAYAPGSQPLLTCFTGGRAFLGNDKGKWACIDASGSWALRSAEDDSAPYVYDAPIVFVDGRGIDRSTCEIIDTEGNRLGTIDRGLAGEDDLGRDLRGGRYYFDGAVYDETGAKVVGGISDIGYFSDGVCPAESGGWWGLLNADGSWAISPRYQQINNVSNGLVFAMDPATGLFGYADLDGDWVVHPRFRGFSKETLSKEIPSGFSATTADGLALVMSVGMWSDPKNSSNREGWIDRSGNWVVSWQGANYDGE